MQRFSFPFDAGPFVWLLLILAFLALVFAVERALFLHRGLVLSSDFIEGVRNNLRAGRPLEALAACEESPGPVPRVVKAALLRAANGEAAMRAAATEAALLELPVLERRLGTIAAIGRENEFRRERVSQRRAGQGQRERSEVQAAFGGPHLLQDSERRAHLRGGRLSPPAARGGRR